MRVSLVTKDYGTIRTAEEPFSQQRFDELVAQMEEIGDTCDDGSSFSIDDDKGNKVILNSYVLRQAVIIIER
jgi:hypothetical protein